MDQTSMTAKISMFSRYYHAGKEGVKIYNDTLAGKLLSEEEKQGIAASMSGGISFFNPGFEGAENDALRWIVDNQLSPSPLGRAAFCEHHLMAAVQSGATQYLMLAAGYDTFAYRLPEWARTLEIFELDLPDTAKDKRTRLKNAGISVPRNVHFLSADLDSDHWAAELSDNIDYKKDCVSFCSLLGISYYLSKNSFENTVKALSGILAPGSGIVFDYPDENSYTDKAGERTKKQQMLAGGANEEMKASYSQGEISEMLYRHGFAVEEDLTPAQITKQYFAAYNKANPDLPMTAFDNVNYCFARKK